MFVRKKTLLKNKKKNKPWTQKNIFVNHLFDLKNCILKKYLSYTNNIYNFQ